MIGYLKQSLGDLVLTALSAVALCYLALDGFYVSPSLQYGVVPAIVAVACTLMLFLVARNSRTARMGGIIYAACLVVSWVVAAAMTPGGDIFTDNESNYLIFVMVTTFVPTLVFLVSRKRTGAALLFVGGSFFAALLQLLYQRFELAWVIVFLAASLALIVFKNYQLSLRTATSVRAVSMLPGFVAALCTTLVAVGLGAGIWFGIIAPTDPDAVEIKLITEYRALETRQVLGTSNVFQTPNLDMTSNVTNDGTRTTDDIKESLNGDPWPATGEEEEPDDQEEQNTFLGIDMDSLQQQFDFEQNPNVLPMMLAIIVVIVALIVAYFILRRMMRARKLKKLQALGPQDEYKGLFLLLLRKFERIGIGIGKGQTVSEFGDSSASVMNTYNQYSGSNFKDLAYGYCAVAYGGAVADDESLHKLEEFYRTFWKACRHELGNVKYFFKAFKL